MLFREAPGLAAMAVMYNLSTDARADNADCFYPFDGINETFPAKVWGVSKRNSRSSLFAYSDEKHTTGSHKNPEVLLRLSYSNS